MSTHANKSAADYINGLASQKTDLEALGKLLLDLRKQAMPIFRVSETSEALTRNGKYGSLQSRILDLNSQMQGGPQHAEFQKAINKSLPDVDPNVLERTQLSDIVISYFGEQYKDHFEKGIADPLESLLAATREHLPTDHPLRKYTSLTVKDTHRWGHASEYDTPASSVGRPGWYAFEGDKAGEIRRAESDLRLALSSVESLGAITTKLSTRGALRPDHVAGIRKNIEGIYHSDFEESTYASNFGHALETLKKIRDKKLDNYDGHQTQAFHCDQRTLQHHIDYIEHKLLPLVSNGKDMQDKLNHHVDDLEHGRQPAHSTHTPSVAPLVTATAAAHIPTAVPHASVSTASRTTPPPASSTDRHATTSPKPSAVKNALFTAKVQEDLAADAKEKAAFLERAMTEGRSEEAALQAYEMAQSAKYAELRRQIELTEPKFFQSTKAKKEENAKSNMLYRKRLREDPEYLEAETKFEEKMKKMRDRQKEEDKSRL